MAYTLEQLQKMGAKPSANVYSVEQLQLLGAKPTTKNKILGKEGKVVGGIAGSVLSDTLGIQPKKDAGFVESLFRSTIGSEGLLSLPQKLTGAVVSSIAAPAAIKTEQSRMKNIELANNIIARANKETDTTKKQALFDEARSLLTSGMKTSMDTTSIVNKIQPYAPTFKQVSGSTLQSGAAAISLFGGGAIAKSAATTSAKEVLKNSAITGAKAGALFGAGSALQEDKTASEIILSSIGGGITGAIGGTIAGGIALTPTLVKSLPNIARNKLENASSKFLNLSPSQVRLEGKYAKNTPKFIVEEGVYPLLRKGQNGTLDTTDAVEALKGKYDIEESAFESVLKDSGKYFDLNKLEQRTIAAIDTPINRAKGTEYTKMIEAIKNQFNSLRSNFANDIISSDGQALLPADTFNLVKRGAWSATKGFGTVDDKVLSDTNYQIGHSAKEMIEEGIDDAGIKSMNSRLGDFSAAIKILNSRNGIKMPGGRVGRYFARVVGAVTGATGGPVGSIVGSVSADKLADVLADPRITASIYQRMIKKYGRDIVAEAEEILQKRAATRAITPRLPSPTSIQLGPK